MPDAKLPVVGGVPKPVLIGGVLIGGVAAAVIYFKHKSTAAAPASDSNSSGYGYGSYGYAGFTPGNVNPYEYGYGQYGYGYYGYGGQFAGLGGYGSPTPVTNPVTAATTNAGWSQAAESYLSGTTGANESTVSAALGKYISGGTVTTDQQTIIQEAIAFEGYPPVPGTNNYPPNIHVSGTTGQPKSSTKTIKASGTEDLSQIAHAHHTTGGRLIAMKGNSWLTRYYGNKKKIPKGYRISVPA